jgi:hypothetical protein
LCSCRQKPSTLLFHCETGINSVDMDQLMPSKTSSSSDDSSVVCFFEKLQSAFLDEFEKDVAGLSISLKKRPSQYQISSDEKTLAFEKDAVQKQVTYSWPGKSPHEAWRFSRCLCITVSFSCSRKSRLHSASSLAHIRSCSRQSVAKQTVR